MKTRRNNKRPIKHGIKTRSKRQKGSGNRWSRIGCTTHQNNMDEEDPNSIHDYLQLVIEDEDALHVKKYLKKGANPNVMITDEHEYLQEPELVPAIIYVARHIQPSTILKYLVQFGASVERDPNTGSTPLIEAAEWGNLSAVEYLLDIGVDINATTGSGVTAIGYAVLNEDIPMIKLMLKERKGEIDFNYSVFGDNENVIEDTKNPEVARILKNYAIEQQIPIHLGRQYHRLQVGDVMDKKRMPRDLTHLLVTKYAGGKRKTRSKIQRGGSKDEDIALLKASSDGNIEEVKDLLSEERNFYRAKVDARTYYNDTALIYASENGHIEIVEVLLDNGADVNAYNNYGNTALMMASENGHIEIVEMLLKKGADLDAKNNDGETALKTASEKGHEEVVEMLLDNGADVKTLEEVHKGVLSNAQIRINFLNEKIENNENLKESKQNDLQECEEKILKKQEDEKEIFLKKQEDEKENFLKKCFEHINRRYITTPTVDVLKNPDLTREIKKYLRQKCGGKKGRKTRKNNKRPRIHLRKTRSKRQKGGMTALMDVSRTGHAEIVKMLLENGADVNEKDNEGWTALIWASANGHTKTVSILLEKGANVNAKSYIDISALHQASLNGHTEIVEILLDKEAEVNASDNEGWTALIQASLNGHTEIVEILLDKGAEMNAEDNEGWTALMWASERGHTEIINLIREREREERKKNIAMTRLVTRKAKLKDGRDLVPVAKKDVETLITQFLRKSKKKE